VFAVCQNGADGKNLLGALNLNILQIMKAYALLSLAQEKPNDKFQFERHGYFVAD
jgi:glutaminyl-tRNA synthetase